jgi:hypothetical protein
MYRTVEQVVAARISVGGCQSWRLGLGGAELSTLLVSYTHLFVSHSIDVLSPIAGVSLQCDSVC